MQAGLWSTVSILDTRKGKASVKMFSGVKRTSLVPKCKLRPIKVL